MPKISWEAAKPEDILTAEDIDEAEEGFSQYTGEIPPGGVYRFKRPRFKYTKFGTGNEGFNNLMFLDGSWKPAHKQYDGCPLWDKVTMTKAAAGFAKAFAAALGVSAADLVARVVVDGDGYVTKIGKKNIDENLVLYVAVKRGMYNEEPRLEAAGTGYQVVEGAVEKVEDDEDAPPAKKSAKAAAGKPGKKNKNKSDDEEPPF